MAVLLLNFPVVFQHPAIDVSLNTKKKNSPSAGNINIFMNISAFHSLLLHDKIILNANEFYFIITWSELWSRCVQEP